jgi:hypothetical protein
MNSYDSMISLSLGTVDGECVAAYEHRGAYRPPLG